MEYTSLDIDDEDLKNLQGKLSGICDSEVISEGEYKILSDLLMNEFKRNSGELLSDWQKKTARVVRALMKESKDLSDKVDYLERLLVAEREVKEAALTLVDATKEKVASAEKMYMSDLSIVKLLFNYTGWQNHVSQRLVMAVKQVADRVDQVVASAKEEKEEKGGLRRSKRRRTALSS